jgi:outer membrane protein
MIVAAMIATTWPGSARVVFAAVLASLASAQPAGSQTALSIRQAVDAALKNYPSIEVTQEQINAAAAGIRLAQTAYLPRVDGLGQINRATRNNVFGMMLPQNVLPPISGPVLGTNNLGTVWSSAAGILVTWQPFDFGLRRAQVEKSAAMRDQARAALERTSFEVAVAAADAFLTEIAAEQTAEAARAAVESWEVLRKTTHAQVAAQLKPGADESRVEAELAAARTQLAQSEQAVNVARANVARFIGRDPSETRLAAGRIVHDMPPDPSRANPDAAANPIAREQRARIASAEAELKALQRTDYPQFFLEGSASARGTGADLNGARLGGLNGLAPATQNYAIGLTVVFPFMDRYSIREREAAQTATIRAGQAQYRVIATDLRAQFEAAIAALDGARLVAANTRVEFSSAQRVLDQATARYRSGLAPIDDVAQAQRLLAQARIDDSLAHLNVWRAWLALEAARGDIEPFLVEATR